jgi:DNA-binding CsgD family transcriptional regulator
MLKEFSPAQRVADPWAIMLRAMLSVLMGDAPGGVRLLRRAVARATEPVRSYALDLLVPLLITSSKIDEAAATLEGADEPARELLPGFTALWAVLAACRGHHGLSRRLAGKAIMETYETDRALSRARVLQRCSLAAYYRNDYSEAHERSLEAASLYESSGAYRSAAGACSVPYVISYAAFNDAAMAQLYADRIIEMARRADDLSLVNFGLVSRLDLAASTGDQDELTVIWRQLQARPLHEQYGERASTILAAALAEGWAGRFDAARVALLELRGAARIPLVRGALFDALIALCAAAKWHLPEARRHARRALSQAADRTVENCSDAHLRRIARVIAAAACIIIGDSTRGRRALTRGRDNTIFLPQCLTVQGLDENSVPVIFRGYARMIDVAVKSAVASRPIVGLTLSELRVLRALPDGTTLAVIAAELGKSPETVKKQVHRIYGKLGVGNRVQAINRARDLRLI